MLRQLFLTVGILGIALQADYLLKYNMDGEVNTFYYKDEKHAKMVTPPSENSSTEIYSLDKKSYIVTVNDGMTSIIDVDKAKNFINSMGVNFMLEKESEPQMPQFSIKKTGKKETVAGVRGEVWILSYEGESAEVVVTDNKKVVQITQKMFDMLLKLSDDASKNVYEIKKGYMIIKGEGIVLQAFEEKKFPNSTYELPSTSKSKTRAKQNSANEEKASAVVQKPKEKVVLKPISDDPCFTNVCCGKKAGKSKILEQFSHLKGQDMFDGYELYEAAACKDGHTEDALFVGGDARKIIRVTLNMKDSKGGVIKNIKLPRREGPSRDVNSIELWSEGEWYNKVYSGRIVKTKQVYLDYVINSKTSLCFTSKNKDIDLGPIDLYGNVDIKGIMFHFNPHLKENEDASSQSSVNEKRSNSEKNDESAMDSISDADVDKAANLLKSFF